MNTVTNDEDAICDLLDDFSRSLREECRRRDCTARR